MSAKSPHLLLVEALFYEHIAADLRRGAERAVAEAGATCEVISVPGSFEVPVAIAMAAKAGAPYDGYVALGCVIRGETSHYDHICNETARALQELMRCGGVAAGYGILTVENEAQALVRASPDATNGGRDKGGEAVRACLALIDLKRRFAGNRR